MLKKNWKNKKKYMNHINLNILVDVILLVLQNDAHLVN